MKNLFITALRVTLVTILLSCALYPIVVTAAAQLFFPWRANGSLIDKNGARALSSEAASGSLLLAQQFTGAAYLQPRPSAANYDAATSTGSNLGQSSKKLQERVAADTARLLSENPDAKGPLPVELVTTSASGLDPEISLSAANWQAPRIAKARGVALSRVSSLIEEYAAASLFGEPIVNVLQVNIALNERFGAVIK